MIDKTRWAVVLVGPLTASGYDEIHARFVLKRDAETLLKQVFGGIAKARRAGYAIRKLP